ncbi:hypothetical protein KIN20_027957 [Parelaphostrongylus tenuis]|uniref:Catalase core domain-containing protein n=1 Tax=Parelaphostrongylus tenuis TaxID=148309 RepID=A0AAD5R0C5_PARTN|nr:hypothetical protein KIN20_027957 [Parelaphostrongylus tenuis]
MTKIIDPCDEQLEQYKKSTPKTSVYTTSTGAPIGNKNNSLTVGPRMSSTWTKWLTSIVNEFLRGFVHAKGAGAHGYFEVTHNITKYCKADIFSSIGKQTPCFVRFSVVGGESGSADTVRDPRGFAIKFYTEEGNWDLVNCIDLNIDRIEECVVITRDMVR